MQKICRTKCFYILNTRRASCEIPIWHGDRQGTRDDHTRGLDQRTQDCPQEIGIGTGVANIACNRMIFAYGEAGTVDTEGACTEEMRIESLAGMAETQGLLPATFSRRWTSGTSSGEAVAIAMKAQEQGIARIKSSAEEEHQNTSAIKPLARRANDEARGLDRQGTLGGNDVRLGYRWRWTSGLDSRGLRAP